MILIIGTIRLPPENVASARAAMETMVVASRAEDGCIDYAYAEDLLDPGLIRVIETWRDQQALDRHFASPHIAQWRGQWPALKITGRDLHAYDVGNSRLV